MKQGTIDRGYWIQMLRRICDPVLMNLKNRTLRANMPVEQLKDNRREYYTHLEALGRILIGIGPWLECKNISDEEESLRMQYAKLCREAIDAATDPKSPDFMNFTPLGTYDQPLVDAAFLASAILRAPNELWRKLEDRVKENLASCLMSTRVMKPGGENNHILFSALVESALFVMGKEIEWYRVEYALMRYDEWYKGDGVYGDGMEYHWDYYNSYVMHPALIDIYDTFMNSGIRSKYLTEEKAERIYMRAGRYAYILEMLIGADGSFPATGRSITYRMGAFRLLSMMAYMNALPKECEPGEVRSALTAVIRKCMEAPGTFDENGWLQIGLCGHQPELGEGYVSTGSLYECTHVFLALGLSPQDSFWNTEFMPWHSIKIWNGYDMFRDAAYKEDKVRGK